MKLKSIVTLANSRVRLRFLAMERSLRATGCSLPLRVIPYDDRRFSLPANADWWEMPAISDWVRRQNAHPTMRKYQCLTIGNYQFADADVCFLRDPSVCLAPHEGFITSCGHWHNPAETVTPSSLRYFLRFTTVWQSRVFNTGQFACDRPLYDVPGVIRQAEHPDFCETCVRLPHHEQPGINQLVFASGIPVTNLTLPPTSMESTWAGDYPGEDFRARWTTEQRTPCLIHWAGVHFDAPRPIDELFLSFLTREERTEWEEEQRLASTAARRRRASWKSRIGRTVRAFLHPG